MLLSTVSANDTKYCSALFCPRFCMNCRQGANVSVFCWGHSSYLRPKALGIIWASYRFEMKRVQQLLRETMLWPALICVAHYFCDILSTMNSCNEQPGKVATFWFPGPLLLAVGKCSLSSTYAPILGQLVQGIDFSLYAALQANDIQELSAVMRFLGLWCI